MAREDRKTNPQNQIDLPAGRSSAHEKKNVRYWITTSSSVGRILSVSMPAAAPKDKVRFSVLAGLPVGFAAVTAAKFLTNVSFRMVFPFLPRIAEGLGVSLTALGTALAIRELIGLANPALGRSADRRGHRPAMVVAMLGLGLALVLQGVSGGLVLFTIALVGVSLTKALFDVAAGAWVGDLVPLHARGRGIGLLETSWAAAFIIGIPIAALIIRVSTWRTPFLVCSVLCVLMAVVLRNRLWATTHVRASSAAFRWTKTVRTAVSVLLLVGTGQAIMLVSFASWLEDEHDASVAGLGLTAMIIGFAELGGSATSAAVSDRIGLGRSLRLTLVGATMASLLLVGGSSALGIALVTMALYFFAVEFCIVAILSVFSELDPNARATAFGIAFAAFAIGHAVGAVVGTSVYETWGMTENAILMAVLFAIAYVPARVSLDLPSEVAR